MKEEEARGGGEEKKSGGAKAWTTKRVLDAVRMFEMESNVTISR